MADCDRPRNSYVYFELNGHIQCLIVQYETCRVDIDSFVNPPVVIFVEKCCFSKYSFDGELLFEQKLESLRGKVSSFF